MDRCSVIHTIETDEEYRAALAEIDAFMSLVPEPDPLSPEGLKFSRLVNLVQAYEGPRFPL